MEQEQFKRENLLERIEQFLEDFVFDLNPESDHKSAREDFRDIFEKLTPNCCTIRGRNFDDDKAINFQET